MNWFKRYKCENCGKEYSGTKYSIKKEKGKDFILCEDCFNKHINKDLEKFENEKKEFEKRKNSMKYLYKTFRSGNFGEDKKKSPRFNLEIDTYSDRELTTEERRYLLNISLSNLLFVLKKEVLSTKIGDIVFRGQTIIDKPKANIIRIIKKISLKSFLLKNKGVEKFMEK